MIIFNRKNLDCPALPVMGNANANGCALDAQTKRDNILSSLEKTLKPKTRVRTLFKLELAPAGVLAVAVSAAGWLLQPGLNQDYRLSTAGQRLFTAVERVEMWRSPDRRQPAA